MVFCYKLVMESPRRSTCVSSRKKSPIGRTIYRPSAVSDLITTVDYEDYDDVLGSIPERDWRLMTALARKRVENKERDRLAEQFRKMWLEEKREREMIEAVASEQYKRYLNEKRARERSCQELMQCQRRLQQHVQRGQLMDNIRYKDKRSSDLLALNDDRKVGRLIDNALEEESRAYLAADRRSRQALAEQRRRSMELVYALTKEHEARRRKTALLRDASRRVAISNALSNWESSILRQEIAAEEECKRAQAAARVAHTDARAARLSRARDVRTRRARRLAAFTERLRDAVKLGQI